MQLVILAAKTLEASRGTLNISAVQRLARSDDYKDVKNKYWGDGSVFAGHWTMLVMGMFNLIASLIGMRQTTTSGFHSDLNSRFFLIFSRRA